MKQSFGNSSANNPEKYSSLEKRVPSGLNQSSIVNANECQDFTSTKKLQNSKSQVSFISNYHT